MLPPPVPLTLSHSLLPFVEQICSSEVEAGPFTEETHDLRKSRASPTNFLLPFFLSESEPEPIGLIRTAVLNELLNDNAESIDEPCWKMLHTDGGDVWAVCFTRWLNDQGELARSREISRMLQGWRDKGIFTNILSHWRNELWAIRHGRTGETLFHIERAAAGLFGFSGGAAHMTGFIRQEDGSYHIWVGRRSCSKKQYPLKLDNMVAGGIVAGSDATPLQAIIREAYEEASLSADFLSNTVKHVDSVKCISQRGPEPAVNRGLLYVYELDFSTCADARPIPNDDEVEDFTLLSAQEVADKIFQGEFVYWAAAVLAHFFVRHGLVNQENEPQYALLCDKLGNQPKTV